ncbi:MAG: hypothetical protein Q7T44_05935 [Parvibaculum sp.]|nr:hypothetical protein [Parvibaculum sp.]
MNDSIYRDFYWMADQVRAWWATLWPYLVSDTAIRIYAFLSALIIIFISLWIAYRAKERIRDLKYEAFGRKYRGRSPTRRDAIRTRITAMKAHQKLAWLGFSQDFLVIIVFGLAVPAVGLFLFCTNYYWFDETGIALIGLHDGLPATNTTYWQLMWFVTNQIIQGSLLDYPEVFNLFVGELRNNDKNFFFSSLVLTFRTIVGAFSITLGIAIWDASRTIWKIWRKPPEGVFRELQSAN